MIFWWLHQPCAFLRPAWTIAGLMATCSTKSSVHIKKAKGGVKSWSDFATSWGPYLSLRIVVTWFVGNLVVASQCLRHMMQARQVFDRSSFGKSIAPGWIGPIFVAVTRMRTHQVHASPNTSDSGTQSTHAVWNTIKFLSYPNLIDFWPPAQLWQILAPHYPFKVTIMTLHLERFGWCVGFQTQPLVQLWLCKNMLLWLLESHATFKAYNLQVAQLYPAHALKASSVGRAMDRVPWLQLVHAATRN